MVSQESEYYGESVWCVKLFWRDNTAISLKGNEVNFCDRIKMTAILNFYPQYSQDTQQVTNILIRKSLVTAIPTLLMSL